MARLSSSIFFLICLISLNHFEIYQSISLKKSLFKPQISHEHHYFNHGIKGEFFLETDSKSGYLYTNYMDYEWPQSVQDCTVYESLLPLFNQSYNEVVNIQSSISSTYTSKLHDKKTGITFINVDFQDSETFLESSEKNRILTKLQENIDNLTDIIDNDRCNFYATWQNNLSGYMCSSTAGTVDGHGKLDDKCARYKMYYAPYNGERAYCFQSLYTGSFCTSEQTPTKNRPLTCNRSWCRTWEQFRTNQTRKSSGYNFQSRWDTYMTVGSSYELYANSASIGGAETFYPTYF